MPDSCVVFGCNNESDPENGIALQRIPFFTNRHLGCEKKKKIDQFCKGMTSSLFSFFKCREHIDKNLNGFQ